MTTTWWTEDDVDSLACFHEHGWHGWHETASDDAKVWARHALRLLDLRRVERETKALDVECKADDPSSGTPPTGRAEP